ncbi:MAG: glucuronate isomerase, partial [Actinobacteria bacterium]|nr:glucuronate isomerase [Actinomycetota bacterium]
MSVFPILSPHGHVNPKLLAENSAFADPVELLISPDHYITRMLASQGVTYEELNLPDRSGERTKKIPAEQIWQLLAENWQALAGTPSRIWFEEIL